MNISPSRRFDKYVKRDPETGCLIWTASGTGRSGYGIFWHAGRLVMAHRFAWERVNGPIPEGLEPDHLCRVRRCVNPSHLEVVTHRTNVLRGVGPTAQNARKSFCVRGHTLDEKNTYYRPNGKRDCRVCHRLQHAPKLPPDAKAKP
jgi:hypothetical protein